jgi:hypothetical protein
VWIVNLSALNVWSMSFKGWGWEVSVGGIIFGLGLGF